MIDSTIKTTTTTTAKTTTNTNKFFMKGHPGYVPVRSPRREIDVSSAEGGPMKIPPYLRKGGTRGPAGGFKDLSGKERRDALLAQFTRKEWISSQTEEFHEKQYTGQGRRQDPQSEG